MMGSNDVGFILLAILGGAVALGVAIALIVVAVKVTGGLLAAIAWLVKHVVRFVFGLVKDAVSLVGSTLAAIVTLPFATFNVILGRWDAAGRWGRALRRETLNVGYRCYSIVLKRPLELLCLDGVLTGVERRLPQADEVLAATNEAVASIEREIDPGAARRGPSEFEGYSVEGTLRPGGSGAKLYIASPSDELRRRLGISSERVVIKSFALEEGSSLPQIVRESRALDSARALGLVFDHGLDNGRFWYAMPYHPGESLAETARFLHARAGSEGLHGEELREAIFHTRDLVATLCRYHQGGLWHKDVKPDNIIVHDGKAHLVDLGLVTPLRSAMTLTTHGTEYFRDPEMVRQALRGVRVHQVDGAKFDIYGAGAVLYFLLENTFPAHGGLSSFQKRSPEALRWIVRRAMADYHQRYHGAQAMLDDLAAVAQSSDPWSLKPIELPSMRAADLNAVSAFPHAGAPAIGAAIGGAGMGVGAGVGGVAAGAGGWMGGAAAAAHGVGVAAAAAIPSLAGRPRLVVTNWWSGSYASPDVAERVHGVRTQAAEAALAAREAVRAHRKEPRRPRPEPPRLASMFGLILPIAALVFGLVMALRNNGNASLPANAAETAMAAAMAPKRLAAPTSGTRIVLVNDHPAVATSELGAMVDRVVASYEKSGFTIVRDDQDIAAKLSLEIAKGRTDAGEKPVTSTEIEAALAAAGYWGALHVRASDGTGTTTERFQAVPIGEKFDAAVRESKGKRSSRASKERSKETPKDSAPMPIPAIEIPTAPPAPTAPAAPAEEPSRRVTEPSVSATLFLPADRAAESRSIAWHRPQDLGRRAA